MKGAVPLAFAIQQSAECPLRVKPGRRAPWRSAAGAPRKADTTNVDRGFCVGPCRQPQSWIPVLDRSLGLTAAIGSLIDARDHE
jgi:hypothetical protein